MQSISAELPVKSAQKDLGVDAWQAPNGFDILRVVNIYRLVEDGTANMRLEAMPLDFIRLSRSHTGEYLATMVSLVVEKFGIQNKICGLVSNNASNNEVMVRELKKLKWPRFKGEPQWMRCFAHVLNLIVQGILWPIGTQKRSKASKDQTATTINDSEESDLGEEDPEDQIRLFDGDGESPSSSNDEDASEVGSLDQGSLDDSESLSLEDIENASDEGEDDLYTSCGCKESLAKFWAVAKKLKYCPNSKTKFVDICIEKECQKPHNVQRDVRTRWNSTSIQVNSIRHKRHGIERKYYLDENDFILARHLADLLNEFYEITRQISIAGSARLSNIVVFINQITEHLSSAISGSRIAIILHPSFRDEYFKLAHWELEWISEAIRLARDMWVTSYKPKPIAPTASSSLTTPSYKASI
ncbi:hypothetical protein PSTG_09411 [Puccinia striiformis f. sp. tritici PST-78]|uniref:DUF659 domain-containing protein n=1 Tax=Puccinia striiformis f. sp. tritici PST-78 TaxID=1165861 RepID=A0A0L0VDC8_9BASI|nr:hypothetical protein PSTG_09411 [Puccinia striiformis f. sp. tritici PST-78]